MSSRMQVIDVDREKCVNCHRCIAVCPAKMCNNGAGDYVKVNADLCLGCGECIDACTHGARRGLDDTEAFFDALDAGRRIVAVVAPAAAASFGGRYLRLNGWLKSLGVAAFFDVSFGAELTVKSYLEHKRSNPGCVISQPCPALVYFIEIYRPSLIPLLAPADSPMVHTMKMVRRFHPEYAGCEFAVISPCYAKRREFAEVGIGDYNVTIRSLEARLEERGVDLARFPETGFENPPAERASLFSTPGGLMRTAARYSPELAESTRKIEGHPDVFSYLAHLDEARKAGKSPIHEMVDCLNCDMGCNGGAGTNNRGRHLDDIEGMIEGRARAAKARYASRRKGSPRRLEKLLAKYYEPGLYARSYVDRSSVFKGAIRYPSAQEIEACYRAMRKEGARDILNCGACGYRSCEQMAVAIINGLNRYENCRHFTLVEMTRLEGEHKSEIASVIESVASSSADRLRRSMGDMQSLADVSSEMSSCVSQSSSCIEQMVANVRSITSILQTNTRSVLDLQEASVNGKAGIDEVARHIVEISSMSDGLLETSAMIKKISSRTNLLAMNAAIEAAHAGEYGRGFAVVADEIRTLAENASSQASSISDVLKSIKGMIDKAVGSSTSSNARFAQVVDLASRVKDQELEIQNAVDEQSAGGKQVLVALEQMNGISSRLRDDSGRLLSASEQILREIERLSGSEFARQDPSRN
jgi:iron only hydrogenase large subunit-like protein